MSRHSIYLWFILLVVIASLSSCTELTDDTVIVSGKITNTSGAGLPDADILLSFGTTNYTEKTDPNGNFRISLGQGGTGFLSISKEGYSSSSQYFTLMDGDHKKINQPLKTISESSYLIIDINKVSVRNIAGTINTLIKTNTTFEVENTTDWIEYTIKYGNELIINYKENDDPTERTGTIKIKGKYGLYHEIVITQDPGPYVRLIDYIGKDNRTSFPADIPFLTFNRKVTLIGKESAIWMDLTHEYSEDQKTIYFPKAKIPQAVESVKVIYGVISDDKVILQGELIIYNNDYKK